jgi:hypothetical protein
MAHRISRQRAGGCDPRPTLRLEPNSPSFLKSLARLALQPFIALIDKAWFDFLSAHGEHGRIDEVNFWSPKSTGPMKTMEPGEPIFFRLKDPHVRSFRGSRPFEAWTTFEERNGDLDRLG